MDYALAADFIAGIHLAIVLYVIVGQLLVVVGGFLKWGWVRNLWFRLSHFLVILIVVLEAGFGVMCPFTTWEYDLRERAGQEGQDGSFIGNLLHDILFVEVPQATLNIVYVIFGLVVFVSLFVVPPRLRASVKNS